MGFFDSVISDKSGASAASGGAASGGTASAAVTVEPVASAPVGDFLIVDDSVTVDSVPDTAADADSAAVSFLSEVPSSAAEASGDLLVMDAPAAETAAEETPVTGGFFGSALETPAAETPAETPAAETASTGLSIAGFGLAAPVEEDAPAPAASSNPEDILAHAISELESVVAIKESDRDAAMRENEELNARISELKKQAKDAQERAKEIDQSADRARALISNLKGQLSAA